MQWSFPNGFRHSIGIKPISSKVCRVDPRGRIGIRAMWKLPTAEPCRLSESCPEAPRESCLDRLTGDFSITPEASSGSYMAAARPLVVSSWLVSKSIQRPEQQSKLRLLSRATERRPYAD
jgi:hypothetical protein